MANNAALGSIARIAAFCAAFALVYALMIRISVGQQIDSGSFGALAVVNGFFGWPASVFRVIGPVLLFAVGAVFGVWALVRRRFGDAFRAAAIVVCSFGLTELLKDLVLQRPQLGVPGYGENTFPSGHTAFAVSLAIAIAIVLPASRWRWPTIVLVGVVAFGVSWASFVTYAHRPSDVIGGALVVGVVASVVFWGRRSAVGTYPFLVIALLIMAVGGGVLVVTGALLQAAGFALNPGVSLPGWLLVCVVPVIGVIGVIPLSVSRPARTVTLV